MPRPSVAPRSPLRRTSLRVAAAILGLIAVLLLPPGAPLAHASGPPIAPRAVAEPGSQAMQAAIAALGAAHGPSPGATGCAEVAPGEVSCDRARAPGPLVNATSPPTTWINLTAFTPNSPSPRWLAAMTFDPVDNYVLLFGGGQTNTYGAIVADFDDTWSFANGTWTEIYTSSAPSGRYAAGLAWDQTDGYAVLFGGTQNGSACYNDTWTYVSGTWSNLTGTTNQTPIARWRMGMTWDAGDGYVLMFGGSDVSATTSGYNDTWSFLHGTWTQLNPSGSPPTRYRTTMVYDSADGYAVIFGGCQTYSTNCPNAGTWTYHNLSWTQLSPASHPAARVYMTMVYDIDYAHVVLFGGSSSAAAPTPDRDTWAFVDGNWTQITSNLTKSPPSIVYSAAAYDARDHYMVLFGGDHSDYSPTAETWILGPSLYGSLTVSPGAIDIGQPLTVNATPIAFSQYVNYSYPALPPGCVSENETPLVCHPNATGTFPVEVDLSDSTGSVLPLAGSVVVNSDPAILSYEVTPTTVTRGAPVLLSVNATGGTGALTYRYSGLPPGCGSANSENLSCTPSSSAKGNYAIVATVSDQVGWSVNRSLTLHVNAQPGFASVKASRTTVDANQPFTVWANETNGTAPFTYRYDGLPSACPSVNASTFTCTPTVSTLAIITATVTDAFGFSAVGGVNVTVNPDPAFESIGIAPTVIDPSTPITLWINATGGTGALAYSFTGEPPGCSFTTAPVNQCTPLAPGNFTIEITVRDTLGYSVTESIALTVELPLSVGTVAATPASLDAGQTLNLTVAASGGTAPYTTSWTGLPAGCTAVAGALSVECAPHIAGTYPVDVTVTDVAGVSVSADTIVIVTADPSLTSFGATPESVEVGQAVQFVAEPAGGSGVFSFAFAGLPSGCTSVNSSILTCRPSAPGSFNITLTATDSAGLAAKASVLLTVTAVPTQAATLLGVPATTAYALIAVVALLAIALVVLIVRRPPPGAPKAPSGATRPAPSGDPSEVES